MKKTSLRTLLIHPPSTQTHDTCPLGLLMLGAVLEKAGIEPHIIDACAAENKCTVEKIVSAACQIKPDVIGINLQTPMMRESYKLASLLKLKKFKIIAGGPHATLVPQEVISRDFDAVVLGEGEPVIVEAVQAMMGQFPKEKILGLGYKDCENQPVFTSARPAVEDLDSLPFPARHLVVESDYGIANKPLLHSNIFTSRGCPGRCSFCAGSLFGKNFRFRSAKNIIEEICQIHQAYGTKEFHFLDDAMTVNKERIKEFCERLIQLKMQITWTIMTRIDNVNEELLRLLSRAGCNHIYYGVESGHPETLKRIHKSHTIEMAKNIIPLTARYNIKPFLFFLVGFPWETAEHYDATLGLMKDLSPHVDYFHPADGTIIIPFPGTEVYEKYKDEYGFENWWLTDEKHYEQNGRKRKFYFEQRLFTCGNILAADYFHYKKDTVEKIREIFTFMYRHNIRRHNLLVRTGLKTLTSASRRLSQFSPPLENAVFAPLKMLEHR